MLLPVLPFSRTEVYVKFVSSFYPASPLSPHENKEAAYNFTWTCVNKLIKAY